MILAAIQVRTASTRFPQKVLKKIKGKTILELFIDRVKCCKQIDKIVIATTENTGDDIVVKMAQEMELEWVRGSEMDLLDRFYKCAKLYNPDIIVRVTPDDPFVDPEVLDHGIQIFKENDVDFVTNHFEPTFPEGLDVEIYSYRTLQIAWKEAKLASDREHCYPYILKNPNKFKTINFTQNQDNSHLRWTIDHECDFEMTKVIYDHLYDTKPIFLQKDILEVLKKHPDIAEMNSEIKRKEGLYISLKQDVTNE
jgi:spore coat polysaccharide biosynthesis protein SpsF (cytidylyltransferase family)